MPTYEITSPDGKVYEIKAPDGATQEQALEKFKESRPELFKTKGLGQADEGRAFTDVINRGLIAGTLGAPVDIAAMAMRPFGYKEEKPFMGSEYIGQKMEQMGMVSPTRRPVAEFAAGVAPALATGGAGLARALGTKIGETVRTARGRPAAQTAEFAKKGLLPDVQRPLAEQQKALGYTERALGQVQQAPQVQAQRFGKGPLTQEQQLAALQAGQKFGLRQPVREQAAARRVGAEYSEAQAAKGLELASQERMAAKSAVDQLEQQLLARPQMATEDFAKQLRQTTQKLADELESARTSGSNFKGVIDQFGDKPIVNTQALISRAKAAAKKSRNPVVISMMNEIASLAKTDKAAALNMTQADSLRKYLSKDILNKYFAETGADKETLRALKDLRGALIRSTPPEYQQALAQFRTLSRPLDILERQGALAKVIDIDPLSTAYKLTEAQVAGEIINKARAGNPVFTRLLEQSPQLKESGRLYFSGDLFGKEAVPTEAVFRTWLRTNERPLRQLGLYDEFRDLRRAREAANQALDDAKLSEQTAKTALAQAKSQKTSATKLSEESEKRLTSALKTMEPAERLVTRGAIPGIKPRKVSELSKEAETKLTQQSAKQRAAVNLLQETEANLIRATTPKDIKNEIEVAAKKLKGEGLITEEQRDLLLRQADEISRSIDSQEKAKQLIRRAVLVTLGASGLYGGAGYVTREYAGGA